MRLAWLMLATLALASCGASPGPAEKTAVAPLQGFRVAHQPPSSKDVIDAVIASGSVPLTVSPTCKNVGTEPTDATIGRYLAGFLAELSAPTRQNWLETQVEPGKSASGEPVSICRLTLRHVDGDNRWGWGVQFHVQQRDGLVLVDSFVCTGAG